MVVMRIYLIGIGLVMAGFAQATTLTFEAVADDTFTAYISTDDTVLGTQFLSQVGTWQNGGGVGSIGLTAGVTNYLHVIAMDQFGAPSMLIGEASLDDGLFEFGNSSQTLLTNTTEWNLSLTGFGVNYFTPSDLGQNGTGPWGIQSNIDINARRLWSQQTGGEHYFSVAINPVPEPISLIGLGAFGLLLRRKKK